MLAKDNKKLMPRIRPSQEPTTDEVLRTCCSYYCSWQFEKLFLIESSIVHITEG